MNSRRFTTTLRILGWMAFYLLLSAPAIFMASASDGDSFVIRNAQVFDGRKVFDATDVWVESGTIKAVGKGLEVPSSAKAIDAGATLCFPDFSIHTPTPMEALSKRQKSSA